VTIEQAIESYLQEHRRAKHSPKTLEWHQTALSHFQRCLLAERHLLRVCQITVTDIYGWFAFLQQTPTIAGKLRSAHTIETYARSVRAFCNWLVHRGEISHTPLSEHSFPWAAASFPHFIQPEAFEQFTLTSQLPEAKGIKAQHVAARDRAILWVLFDTGITVSELCTLRLGDVDRQTGILRVRGKGDRERQIALGPKSLEHVLWYLKQFRPEEKVHLAERKASEDSLFLSESGLPLTKNSIVLLFGRLRRRAGISGTPISPQILRHSFALRYLQAGGDPCDLRELLGYVGMDQVKLYLHWNDQLLHHRAQCMGESQN
jgi:site-specific recombinase XerD